MTQANPAPRFCIDYDGDRLFFKGAKDKDYQPFTVTKKELTRFENWAAQYQAQRKLGDRDNLLTLGREMYAWLNKADGKWLTDAIQTGESPLIIEFSTPLRSTDNKVNEATAAFLNTPWELLANENGFLAHGSIKYCPVRRLGTAGETAPPSTYQLSLLFMAAEPHDVPPLDYQGEENAILGAVRDIGLELVVEESGALLQMAGTLRENQPDVLHISCHGQNEPPVLCLESEEGDLDAIPPHRLSAELGEHRPALLFLSACLTAQANELLTSYTTELIQNGFPAVLGWGDSVKDVQATQFAARFYHYLSGQNSLEYALAQSRWDMINPQSGEPVPSSMASGDRANRAWRRAPHTDVRTCKL